MWLRAAQVVAGSGPTPLPWPAMARACPVAFAAAPPELTGWARWRWLAAQLPAGPALVASCNGLAEAPWADAFAVADPVVSASCTSGLHAVALARHRLRTQPTQAVLAIDLLSAANHAHFETLRIIDAAAAPFAPHNPGFVPGEAAVHLLLAAEGSGTWIAGPVLGDDLGRLLATLPEPPIHIIAQGTGPEGPDQKELLALPPGVPITTMAAHHGHALGASGPLALARAAAMQGAGPVLVVNRALTGACAAVLVGGSAPWPQPHFAYGPPRDPGPFHHPLLRRLAAEAVAHRPPSPPDLLVMHWDRPLTPPPAALVGGRLLPSAVREITPGFAAALVAQCWGFGGPATALVGRAPCAMLADVPAWVVRVEGDDVHWPE